MNKTANPNATRSIRSTFADPKYSGKLRSVLGDEDFKTLVKTAERIDALSTSTNALSAGRSQQLGNSHNDPKTDNPILRGFDAFTTAMAALNARNGQVSGAGFGAGRRLLNSTDTSEMDRFSQLLAADRGTAESLFGEIAGGARRAQQTRSNIRGATGGAFALQPLTEQNRRDEGLGKSILDYLNQNP